MAGNDLEIYCKMLTDKYVALEKELKESQRKNESLKREIEKQAKNLNLLRQTNDILSNDIQQSEPFKQIKKHNAQLKNENNLLKKQIDNLRDIRDNLLSRINSLTNQNDTL